MMRSLQLFPKPSRARGMMTADALAGLFLLSALATALLVALNRSSRADFRLSQQQSAAAANARIATALQTDSGKRGDITMTGSRVGRREWGSVRGASGPAGSELFVLLESSSPTTRSSP